MALLKFMDNIDQGMTYVMNIVIKTGKKRLFKRQYAQQFIDVPLELQATSFLPGAGLTSDITTSPSPLLSGPPRHTHIGSGGSDVYTGVGSPRPDGCLPPPQIGKKLGE